MLPGLIQGAKNMQAINERTLDLYKYICVLKYACSMKDFQYSSMSQNPWQVK